MTNEFFMANCCMSAFALLILLIVYRSASIQNMDGLFQNKLYLAMLQTTILLLFINILGRFDGHPDTIFPILNHVGNFLLFLFGPVLPALWMLYVHFQIYRDESRTKKLFFPLLIIVAVNSVLTVISQFTGWFYYIDAENIYHRNSLIILPNIIAMGMMLATFILISVKRKSIEAKYFYTLAFFVFPPLFCYILQMLFYGLDLTLMGITLSLLNIFLNIQDSKMSVDYLTGAFNRKQLDAYIDNRIKPSAKKNPFGAILIDLDDFKAINDTFGHDTGDDALITTVEVVGQCIRNCDFIARYGGDEFYVVLAVNNMDALETVVRKINARVDAFNKQRTKPYQLSFSMGYAMYDYSSGMTAEGLFRQIDNHMYENKRARKARNITNSH